MNKKYLNYIGQLQKNDMYIDSVLSFTGWVFKYILYLCQVTRVKNSVQ